MKTRLIILAAGLACGLGTGVFPASANLEVSAGVSIHANADFYEPLTPHGTWVDVGSFGHCWRPAGVAAGWQPYCDGSWEWTDAGWYWVSDEPWAWACYHYGTWDYDSNYGWVWVPGVEWAPSWVNWRIGGGYIGWVPCTPPGVVVAPAFYVFVDNRHFNGPIRPNTIIVNNINIIKRTTQINGIKRENRALDGRTQKVVMNEGPGVKAVEKATGHMFTAVSVREVDSRTSASIPERFKIQTAEPANTERPQTVQPQPGTTERQAVPNENPQERIVPPVEKTVPQAPSEKVVPSHQAIPQTSPEKPRESPNQGGGQGGDKNKDNGGGPGGNNP